MTPRLHATEAVEEVADLAGGPLGGLTDAEVMGADLRSSFSTDEIDDLSTSAVRNIKEFAHILGRFGEAVPGKDGDAIVSLSEILDGHHQVLVDAVDQLRRLAGFAPLPLNEGGRP